MTFSPQPLVISWVLYQSLQTWYFVPRGCLRDWVALPLEFSRAKTFPPSQEAESSGCPSCSCATVLQDAADAFRAGAGLAARGGEQQMHHLGRDQLGAAGESSAAESPGNAESVPWIIRAGCYRLFFSLLCAFWGKIPAAVKRFPWSSLLEKGHSHDVPVISRAVATQPCGTRALRLPGTLRVTSGRL